MPLGKLPDPPITEVATGVMFEPLPELDPVLAGRFWTQIAARYPRKEIHSAVESRPSPGQIVFQVAAQPNLRTWLISEDDAFLIQLQHDRFYANWRGNGANYPRFHDDAGSPGLLRRFVEDYGHLTTFLQRTLSVQPRVTGIELTAVDTFVRNRHWGTDADAAQLLPILGPVLGPKSDAAAVLIRVERPANPGVLALKLQRMVRISDQQPTFQLETTRLVKFAESRPFEDAVAALEAAHKDLKEVFVEQVPESQHYRFEKGWRPK